MAPFQLTLLGGFQARIGTGPALALPRKKAQALLAYLALPGGRAHPRDKLATLLWGDSPEGAARTSFRQALFALRRALPSGGMRVDRSARRCRRCARVSKAWRAAAAGSRWPGFISARRVSSQAGSTRRRTTTRAP